MIKIVVLGAGMVGRAIAVDLGKYFKVTSIDINENSLSLLRLKDKKIKPLKVI